MTNRTPSPLANRTALKKLIGPLLACLMLASLGLFGQSDSTTRIAFYNLENIWHPTNDSLHRDDEFTPDGMRNWSFYRYREKLNLMAKAIVSIGKWNPPDLLGFAEVENRQVLYDLAHTSTLRKLDYQIIHYESPDRRGIDVCAFYRKEHLDILHSSPHRVPLASRTTRDVLYIKTLSHGDTVHVLYNHWPSRYGGQKASEPNRIAAARVVRALVDSIRTKRPKAAIVIMGDLNDEWHNISILDSLGAKALPEEATESGLVNLMATLPENAGSHRYQGKWGYLDQIIVSTSLLEASSPRLSPVGAVVVRHDFLLEKDPKYPGERPFRSFIGMRYHGGFSDHLPIYIDLWHTAPKNP